LERDGLSQVASLDIVQEDIRRVEERMYAQADDHHSELQAALKHLVVSGGKRIRPALTLLTGEMLGGDKDRLITLAAAIEMLHTATLVHDDLIDGALLRRGIPTLNARWSPGATVLTGDFIFATAARLAAETDSVRVMHLFAQTLAIIVNGEITQMFSSHGVASRDDYYRRIHAKTASMFELATAAAAVLSYTSENVIEAVGKFGSQVGMAFQIVDDILDFTGEQVRVGKPVASDLRQGLITLPALYYYESNPGDPRMRAVIQGSVTEQELESLIIDIRTGSSVQEALNEARKFVERGVGVLDQLPPNSAHRSLAEVAYYIVDREL
jgi:geranylgeranyl pyrophosphate synthase